MPQDMIRIRTLLRPLAAFAIAIVIAGCTGAGAPGVDMILTDGVVWTGSDEQPFAEAVAVDDGMIAAVGSNGEIVAMAGAATTVIDLGGRFLSPGFIDNHTHFNRAGELLLGVNLLDVAGAEGMTLRVGEAAERLPNGAWMVGGSWGAYEEWEMSSTGREGDAAGADAASDESPRFDPDRSLIDPVSPGNPAILWNWDRSLHLANGAALEAAGADCDWPGVECEDGEMTGRVSRVAADRIRAAIPPRTAGQRLAEARVALERLAENGVTTIFDITPPEQLPVYQELRRRGELTTRVNVRPVLDSWDELGHLGIGQGYGDGWLRFNGLKGFVDGIMGNSSARFYEPYLTTGVRGEWRNPSNTGHVSDAGSGMDPPGNMERLVFGADSIGLSPRVHAIGDHAIDSLLDIFEKVITTNGPDPARRFAVIHVQVLSGPEPARRMAGLGIIAEMQPYHTIDDMRWMEERIGERSRWAYAFRTLEDAGVLLSFGSDWPGTNAAWYTSNPLVGMYSAVTRQTLDGQPGEGWFPEERISAESALRAYTVNNAFASGEEDVKGRIAPGFYADLVVVDRNPLEVPAPELKDLRVELTVVGGRIVHDLLGVS